MASVINSSNANFQSDVLDQSKPVLVDFWAPWCSYCNKMAPSLEELAAELDGKLIIVKVNVDENRTLAQTYGVMSLPTMLLFKEGNQVEKIIGFVPKQSVVAKVQSYL